VDLPGSAGASPRRGAPGPDPRRGVRGAAAGLRGKHFTTACLFHGLLKAVSNNACDFAPAVEEGRLWLFTVSSLALKPTRLRFLSTLSRTVLIMSYSAGSADSMCRTSVFSITDCPPWRALDVCPWRATCT